MENKKKKLKKEYQQAHLPMGIFQVRNLVNGKVMVGASLNLPGVLNREKFSLTLGGHPNKKLQAEWQKFGSENFVFEVLDELAPTAGAEPDYRADLAFLEEFWLDKLQPYDERGYNEKKKGKEEMLRQIAQNRSQKPE